MSAAPDKLRIIIADDNGDAADSLAMLLQMEGYDVSVVSEGVGALRAIEKTNPEVALLDIGMPELNGYEVARRVRDQRMSSVTLIALTGWGTEADKAKAMAAGFDHHLTKPVEPDALFAMLQTINHR